MLNYKFKPWTQTEIKNRQQKPLLIISPQINLLIIQTLKRPFNFSSFPDLPPARALYRLAVDLWF